MRTDAKGTARALQTQLHLLNCREALAGMGGTWELAHRCARTLERLMEGGTPVGSGSVAGKRKREVGPDARKGGTKRRDVQAGGERKREREQRTIMSASGVDPFDFDAAGCGAAKVDGLTGFSSAGDSASAGLWEGSRHESLWGRGAFCGGGQFSGGGGGRLGLGLSDAQPGG